MNEVLSAILISMPVFVVVLLMLWEFIKPKRNVRTIRKILDVIRPRYYFEMFGAEVNPFTSRGLEKYIILDIKDKWVKYDDDGFTESDKIEDLLETMRRKVRLNKCEGWYLKDEHGNILLTV